jgi:hypothetical protein
MAYNNFFPASYQNPYYQQMMPMQQNNFQNNNNSNLIWVQGEAGAKSYLVAPNTTVQLWDSEAQVIYLKSADASGMPSLKILDYTIRDAMPVSQSNAQTVSYVTKTEFDAFKNEVQKMIGGVNNEPTVSANEHE